MVATIRQLVTVEPGGVIRVQSPALREGTVAEVLVTPDQSAAPVSASPSGSGSTWETFIGSGVHSGRTVEEIDASIRELRDEWDR